MSCYLNREHMEMKSFFKRSAISLIVIGMAGSASAGTAKHHHVNNVNNQNVTNVNTVNNNYNNSWSPHMGGWFLGVEGLSLRPENGDLDLFEVSTSFNDVDSSYFQAIQPHYNWNWRVFGGVH